MEKFILFAVAAFSTYISTFFARMFALKQAIIDTPNERSSHSVPTPRGGGIGIGIIWFIGLIFLRYCNEIEDSLFYAFLSGSILFVMGFLDDRFDLRPSIRLTAQFIASGVALWFLGGVSKVDFGFAEIEAFWIWTPIALIGIIWFINLYNFIDGIDGYASMEAIFISFCFFLLFHDSFLLILAAATFGFIIWNWQPAKIFLGDSGSTLLGFNIIIFTIYYQKTCEISILALLIPSVLFWFDASWTLIRRFRNKEKLTKAHKKHAYQRLVQSGFSHQKTVIYAFFFNLIFAMLFFASWFYKTWVFLFFSLSVLIAYLSIKLIDKRKPFK